MSEKKNGRHELPQLFKPGQSGNPAGRAKKGTSLTDILRELGELRDAKTREGEMVTRKEALGNKMWSLALKGNENIAKYIYDRIDGKPTQEIRVGNHVRIDAPIHLHIGAKIERVNDDEEVVDAAVTDSDET
jgi:hypothetical protein